MRSMFMKRWSAFATIAPAPAGAPSYVFFIAGSSFPHGFQASHLMIFRSIATRLRRSAFSHRTDLDGARPGQRNSGGNGDRLVQVLDVDQHVAPELLADLRERAVGH